MTDTLTPAEQIKPETVLEYKILSTDSEALTAEVQFLNPHHSGEHIVEEEYDEVDPETEEVVKKTRSKDNDPNPHMTKTIRVPVVNGKVDHDAFAEIISAQARGVKERMEALLTKQTKKPINLDKAFGL